MTSNYSVDCQKLKILLSSAKNRCFVSAVLFDVTLAIVADVIR